MKYILIKIYYFFWLLINLFILYRNKVSFKSNIQIRGLLFIRNHGVLKLCDNVRINSSKTPNPIGGGVRSNFQILPGSTVTIGSNTKMTNISITSASKIEIGKNVFIGDGVGIFDTDFHPLDPDHRISNRNHLAHTKSILIEDSVFIGTRSLILKGVCIGKNSIVGAGSVVTNNIPPNQIWAGNPAKFIRNL